MMYFVLKIFPWFFPWKRPKRNDQFGSNAQIEVLQDHFPSEGAGDTWKISREGNAQD